MMLDFRKIFHPTQEEKIAQEELMESLIKEKNNYLLSKGLSVKEIEIIDKIEELELENHHRFQCWSSRYGLLQSKIITVEDIKNDIKKYLGGKL